MREWKNKAVDIVQDSSISTINGVPVEQFRNSYNNLKSMDSNIDLDSKLAKAIEDIPSSNIDENAYIKNMYKGKTDWMDAAKKAANNNSKAGARAGARTGAYIGILGILGDGADFVDAAITYKKAFEQYQSGDVEGASDTLGGWGMSTLGGMAA